MSEERKAIQRERLALLESALKSVPGVHAHPVSRFIDGTLSINKKGQLRLPITLPAKEVLDSGADLADVLKGNWKMVPIIVFISAEDT